MQTLNQWSCPQPSRWQLGGFRCAQGSLVCPPKLRHRSSLSLSATEHWHVEALLTPSPSARAYVPESCCDCRKAVLWTGVFLHRAGFVPLPVWYSVLFFETLNGIYVQTVTAPTPTHPRSPCLFLCCPLPIHLTHLECERWQHPGVKMNASHKKMWFEMRGKKNKKYHKGKYFFVLYCFVFQFQHG